MAEEITSLLVRLDAHEHRTDAQARVNTLLAAKIDRLGSPADS